MSSSINDIQFLFHEVLDMPGHYANLGLQDSIDKDFINMILEESRRFTEGELAPLNASGDQGCVLEDGVVTTPEGFKAAYQQYIDGGWAGLCGDPEFGGQGLPESFGFMFEELACTANMAWTMYPGLSRGAVAAIDEHGSAEQKQVFLTKLLTGEWTGTMCLTESHAGSDVGLARTKAELHADGRYRISGTKIFISAGEHDMAENIVHLVLARLPDSPAGTKGISMFLVPKIDLDGKRNSVVCGNIEEKMGIHGNATCELLFDDAIGYLVGEENRGMRYMFTMMNGARLGVGLQGVGVAQAAFNKSSVYAQERLQMRSLSGVKAPDKIADPIIVHPDVRRLLLTQRSIVEGGRALIYHIAKLVDIVRNSSDEEAIKQADVELDFLTPIAKALLTELGFESTNHAMQIFGGHGYIAETGVEQHVRDLRITLLYEGTTAIQSLDLLGRKVLGTQGAGLMIFLQHLSAVAESCRTPFPHMQAALSQAAQEWGEISMGLGPKALANPDEVGAAGVDYLFYSGYIVLGVFWAQMALAAHRSEGDTGFAQSKIDTANFYFARMLPRCRTHHAAILSGADNLMQVSDEAFSSE